MLLDEFDASLSELDIPSPLGTLRLCVSDRGLRSLQYHDTIPGVLHRLPHAPLPSQSAAQFTHMQSVTQQLSEYFDAKRESFDLAFDLEGTSFQLGVWRKLSEIPFGFTKTYTEFARDCGDVLGVRAIASANGKNPVAIIIPCHRVIGSDGAMRGYNGGLARKQWLLRHEGVLLL